MIVQTDAECHISPQSLDNLLKYNDRIKILKSSLSAKSKRFLMSTAKYTLEINVFICYEIENVFPWLRG